MRRLALTSLAAIVAVAAGCGGENSRPRFKAELENHFRIMNREAAVAKDHGAPLVHEYRDVRIPSDTESGMPVAKRRQLDASAGDEAVPGAFSAVVSYTLVTLERKVTKLSIPQDQVAKDARPESVSTTDKVAAVYQPVRYAAGRQLFVFKGGRLIPHPVPYEVPMTEAEQQKVIRAPIAQEAAAASAPAEK